MTILAPFAEEEHREIARVVERFAEAFAKEALLCEAKAQFPTAAWKGLAELGVFGLATPDGGGGAEEIATAMLMLGRANFPGPLVATFVAARLLEGDNRARLIAGELVVALGMPPLMAWAPVATEFVVIENGRAWSANLRGPVEPVVTLGGEPWGRVSLGRIADLGDGAIASALGDIALAAYLVGASARLIERAGEHARTRRQFGRAIGEFQAVAHPLAGSAVRVRAAHALVRSAAHAMSKGDSAWRALAGASRISAQHAALGAAYTAHQTFGALGAVMEGAVFAVSRRIRQWASETPGEHARVQTAVLASVKGPPPDLPTNSGVSVEHAAKKIGELLPPISGGGREGGARDEERT